MGSRKQHALSLYVMNPVGFAGCQGSFGEPFSLKWAQTGRELGYLFLSYPPCPGNGLWEDQACLLTDPSHLPCVCLAE